jgi:hypothetical protein
MSFRFARRPCVLVPGRWDRILFYSTIWGASLLFALSACLGQKTPPLSNPEKIDSNLFDPEARQLVRDIISQTPAEKRSWAGLLKIRDGDGRRSEISLTYTIVPEERGWLGIYEARSTPWRGAERLVIVHRDHQPNEYIHSPAGGPGEAPKQAVTLRGDRAAIPFAGSDYWLSDLGMEFLHWPEQRLVRDAKIKMRLSRPCKVIEASIPTPPPAAIDASFHGSTRKAAHLFMRKDSMPTENRSKSSLCAASRKQADNGSPRIWRC